MEGLLWTAIMGSGSRKYLALVLICVHKVMENHGALAGLRIGVQVFIAF